MKYLICQDKLFFKKINPHFEDFYKIFFNSETSFMISKLFFSISEIISSGFLIISSFILFGFLADKSKFFKSSTFTVQEFSEISLFCKSSGICLISS